MLQSVKHTCSTQLHTKLCLKVPGCKCNKLTVWKEGNFTVKSASGIVNKKARLNEVWEKVRLNIGPGKFGIVQTTPV